jgi:uncharacterized protein (DUF1778 family)
VSGTILHFAERKRLLILFLPNNGESYTPRINARAGTIDVISPFSKVRFTMEKPSAPGLDCIAIAIQFQRGGFRMAKPTKKNGAASPLMVRLDEESKRYVTQAAELRRISVSDYVRSVTVAQARKEVRAAREQSIALSPEEQLAFWNALSETPELTEAQRQLGAVMRGKA